MLMIMSLVMEMSRLLTIDHGEWIVMLQGI